MSSNSYLLEVGEQGSNRLLGINRIYNAGSINFMLANGLSSGMRILDVGGGTGILACVLSEIVGPLGHVTVVDSNQLQANIIRDKKEKLSIHNLSVFNCSAESISREFGCFDIVFCRFLLIHLEKPLRIIKKMLSVLNKKGVLIIEDCVFSQSFCFPKLDAFNKRLEYIKYIFEVSKKDADIGKQLYKMLTDLKLTNVKINLNHPVLKYPHEKIIIPQLLQELETKI